VQKIHLTKESLLMLWNINDILFIFISSIFHFSLLSYNLEHLRFRDIYPAFSPSPLSVSLALSRSPSHSLAHSNIYLPVMDIIK